ncbi:MAG: glutamine-hydrolyzing carbamoyl-phosphate synthase small subunit [Actinobacteria bacterium]|nr:glutamine-hydrolyzing carbamoyl-phosphate synthase small subunit [Actinomycetota bacterium]
MTSLDDFIALERAGRSRSPMLLVLADGEVFEGYSAGGINHGAIAAGELVFNTVMAGYQEVITDPSYAGQVVAFTYPHIGNYGANALDSEAAKPWLNGIVARSIEPQASSWRSTTGFEDWLAVNGIPAITGVDTRRLTRHIRECGAIGCAFGFGSVRELLAAAKNDPGTTGRDLATVVTTPVVYQLDGPYGGSPSPSLSTSADPSFHLGDHVDANAISRGRVYSSRNEHQYGEQRIAVYDMGVKRSMLEYLQRFAKVLVLPATAKADDALSFEPDAVFLSNGPGDPAALDAQVATVSDLIGKVPVFGICLGHQILARAVGGWTYKLRFGHHGGNHPVQQVATGKVEVTSQNHNYAVDRGSVERAGMEISHINLNDGVVEGMRSDTAGVISVQYHPEAAPGPHDSTYLFGTLQEMMIKATRARTAWTKTAGARTRTAGTRRT